MAAEAADAVAAVEEVTWDEVEDVVVAVEGEAAVEGGGRSTRAYLTLANLESTVHTCSSFGSSFMCSNLICSTRKSYRIQPESDEW